MWVDIAVAMRASVSGWFDGTLRADDAGDEPVEEISESANSLWETVLDAVPRVGVALGIVLVGWAANRALRWVLYRWWQRGQTPSFARVMSKLAGWILLIVVVLASIAVTFPSVRPVDLLAGLGFFSVAIGFAFQDILENSLAGVLLLFRQPFTSGDQIEVVDKHGVVEGITIRETRIRGFDGELIVIPNRDVYKNVIVVGTNGPMQRQSFVVGVGYDTDLDATRDVIVQTLRSVGGVVDEPAPAALVAQLNTSTIDIDVFLWSAAGRAVSLTVRDAAIRAVKVALDDAGVSMPADIVELQPTDSLDQTLTRLFEKR